MFVNIIFSLKIVKIYAFVYSPNIGQRNRKTLSRQDEL